MCAPQSSSWVWCEGMQVAIDGYFALVPALKRHWSAAVVNCPF
jgi:hypothetical protein